MQTRRALASISALLTLISAPLATDAQPIIVQPHGTYSVGADGSGSCTGSTTADRCYRATIGAVGVASTTVDLKVAVPSGASIGTVVFLLGGGSGGFMESSGADATTLVGTLKTDGFTVVQGSFRTPTGSTVTGINVAPPGSGVGLKANGGGRAATLIDAIDVHSTLHPAGTPLCLVGQSGGGMWWAYAMVHYGAGSQVDLIITTGGPAITREDYHCEHLTRPEWVAIMTSRQLSGNGNGSTGIPALSDDAWGYEGAHGPCYYATGGVFPWRQDSILSDGADFRLPHTKWYFIFGATDFPDIVVPMARMLEDHIVAWSGSAETCASSNNPVCIEQTAASTPHNVYSTSQGTAAIRTALLADCVNR